MDVLGTIGWCIVALICLGVAWLVGVLALAVVVPASMAFIAAVPVILGCDVRTPEGQAIVRERRPRDSRCLPAVRTPAHVLEGLLAGD